MLKGKFLKLVTCLLLSAIFILLASPPLEAKPANREYTIKAGLIIKFLDFIKWPAGVIKENSPPQYQLCLLGENRFGNLFSHGNNKVSLRVDVKDQELKFCHILFITGENREALKNAIKKLGNKPVLIIAEAEGFAKLGAGINLIKKKNKIKFEINRLSLNMKGLKASSYLLNLAIIVGNES